MATHGTTLIDGRYLKLQQAILDQLPRNIPSEVLDYYLNNKEQLKAFLRGLSPAGAMPSLNCEKAYHKLGMAVPLKAFWAQNQVARKAKWLVPVLERVTVKRVIEAFENLGVKVQLGKEDLDREFSSVRDPKQGSYLVQFDSWIELASWRWERVRDQGPTLLEGLLLELDHFIATRRPLSLGTTMHCVGSAWSGGSTPRLGWNSVYRCFCIGPSSEICVLSSDYVPIVAG